MSSNDLDAYQCQAIGFAVYKEQLYPFFALAEETGEVLGALAKYSRKTGTPDFTDDVLVAKLRDELGDVLWNVANAASELGVSLSDLANENIEKLMVRLANNSIVER